MTFAIEQNAQILYFCSPIAILSLTKKKHIISISITRQDNMVHRINDKWYIMFWVNAMMIRNMLPLTAKSPLLPSSPRLASPYRSPAVVLTFATATIVIQLQ